MTADQSLRTRPCWRIKELGEGQDTGESQSVDLAEIGATVGVSNDSFYLKYKWCNGVSQSEW
jgi:hypothetical protein